MHFKSNYKMEPYINLVSNTFERSLIAKLRCGILQLNVELGRFNQTKSEDRLCKRKVLLRMKFILCVYAQNIGAERENFYLKIPNKYLNFKISHLTNLCIL